MKTYLCKLYRRKTRSFIEVHIQSNSHLDLSKIVEKQFNGWILKRYICCSCPSNGCIEYFGAKLWKCDKYFLILFPGKHKTEKIYGDFTSIKYLIKDRICTLL